MSDLENKIVVVTGAAGNLGKAVIAKFLENNAIVCGLDHKAGRLHAFISESDSNQRLYAFENVDVTDRHAMQELGDRVKAQVGVADILVDTVGGFTYGDRVHELSEAAWTKMFNLNVQSFLNTTSVFVPGMISKGSGKVVAVGARASLAGRAKSGAYAAAKGALLRLTESMAEELKTVGIQVNCVLPGTIDTPENRKDMPNADFSKWVTPDQVAEVILFLASEKASGVTGAAIPIFG